MASSDNSVLLIVAIQIDFEMTEKVHHIVPGSRFVLSCLSNKPNITMYHDGIDIGCDVKPISNNQYNCTVMKERFGFRDAGKYQCSATSFNSRCLSRSKSIEVTPTPGTLFCISIRLFLYKRIVCLS